jgi:hypothetical protein
MYACSIYLRKEHTHHAQEVEVTLLYESRASQECRPVLSEGDELQECQTESSDHSSLLRNL